MPNIMICVTRRLFLLAALCGDGRGVATADVRPSTEGWGRGGLQSRRADGDVDDYQRGGGSSPDVDGGRRRLERANWDIEYLGLTADMGVDSTDEVVVNYEIGKDREFVARVLARNCEDDVTDDVVNATTPAVGTPRGNESDRSSLTLGYSLDKSTIAGSNIWKFDDATNATTIEFCHVLQLVNPPQGSFPMLVIAEDVRRIIIDVDLSVDFRFNQTTFAPTPVVRMKIPGRLDLENVGPPPPEERGRAKRILEGAIEETAEGGLGVTQRLTNSTVLNITEGDGARRRVLLGASGAKIDFRQSQERELQASNSSRVDFELVLEEPCESTTACEELVNSTTMYDDVTAHMIQNINDGTFAALLRELSLQSNADAGGGGRYLLADGSARRRLIYENVVVAPATESDFDEPEVIVAEPGDTPISYAYGASDVNSYVEACKCDGVQSFACDTEGAALLPNSELFVCIWSNSPEVEVDFLEGMVVTQDSVTLNIVMADQVKYPSFTSREYVPNKNGVAVSSRLPSNLFTYGGGESVTITGVIVMKLVGSDRRRLQVWATSDAGEFEEEAPFLLSVRLAPEAKTSERVGLSGAVEKIANDAAVAGRRFAATGTIFGLVHAMLI